MASRKKPKRKTGHYTSDRPINSFGEDKLGRTSFSKRLARDIRDWHGNESLAIALFGKWGSGKTSVKNLVLNQLNSKRYKHQNPVIEINAWQYSGTGSLSAAFFRELAIVLGKDDDPKVANQRSATLSRYASLLSLGARTAKSIGTAVNLLGIHDYGIADSLSQGMKDSSDVLTSGEGALKAQSESTKQSLGEIKTELTELMSSIQLPVIVVFDDIDRLSTDEILEVMQLVKANADFPKLVFLLLFERTIVEAALNKISGNRGREFLEKIVQVGYHVPPASRDSIEQVLFEGLDKSLQSAGAIQKFDQSRWSVVFSDGLDGYFSNLRHVYRFLASFDFHCRHFSSDMGFEVNPIDLVMLETLRVFEPDLYERLSSERRLLTRERKQQLFGGGVPQNDADQLVDSLSASANTEDQERVKKLITDLFPATLKKNVSEDGYVRNLDHWLRDGRVCHPDLFDKYFQLAVADGDVSHVELEQLLASVDNEEDFKSKIADFQKRGVANVAIRRFEAFTKQISLKSLATLAKALCDLGDEVVGQRQGMFADPDPVSSFWRIIYFRLKAVPEVSKRFEIVKTAIKKTKGMILPFQLVSFDERVGDRYDFLLDEEHVEELKQLCLERIREFANSGKLREHPRCYSVLWRWSEWATQAEVKAWLETQLTTPEDGDWFVSLAITKVTAYGATAVKSFEVREDNFTRFVDVESLAKLLKHRKISKTSNPAAETFIEAYELGAFG